LRVLAWNLGDPLHHDEALYGYWARLILSGRDPLLLTSWIDKPPLVIYTLAGALALFGISDQALRVPGLLASVALIPCTWGLARTIYGDRTAWLAALLVSLSPFAILFAPTAFTDPWLTLWLVVAAWAAIGRRPFWAGLALGLAVASKQQGVLGVPLVAVLLALDQAPRTADRRPTTDDRRPTTADGRPPTADRRPSTFNLQPSTFIPALLGFALVFAPVTYWDSLRWATRPSFWDRGVTTYGGLGLVAPGLWPARAAQWATVAGFLFGSPVASIIIAGLAAYAGLADGRRRQPAPVVDANHYDIAQTRGISANPVSALLLAYIAGYLALHFFITFQPWDRYLLPILPLICVLAGRGIERAWAGRNGSEHYRRDAGRAENDRGTLRPPRRCGAVLVRPALALLLAILLGWGVWLGVTARIPIGSDHGAYTGLDRVAAFLRSQPADAVIYDRWLGWHLDFYLFDAPQTRRWWGSGWKLAGDAARTYQETPARDQWLILPGWHDSAAAEIRLALASRNLSIAEVQRIDRADGSRALTLYHIIPPEDARGG
jgi:hypothetical protein